MSFTTDPGDPRLGRGADASPCPMNEAYLVLSEDERARGFIRPLYRAYLHHDPECGGVTTMALPLCETYTRQPSFYRETYCARCQMHRPIGEQGEFTWLDENGNDTHILVGT